MGVDFHLGRYHISVTLESFLIALGLILVAVLAAFLALDPPRRK